MKQYFLFFLIIHFSPSLWAQKPSVSIQLNGGTSIIHAVNQPFVDPGFTATDSALNNYTPDVIITGNVQSTVLGTYLLRYAIADSIANALSLTRTILVVDTVPPVIQPLGSISMQSTSNTFFDPGIKLIDNYYNDTTLRALVTITSSSNVKVDGYFYTLLNNEPGCISYHLTDPSGNKADSVSRCFQKLHIGIPEIENSTFTIYPNPANGIVNIKSELQIDRYYLMDALGNTYTLSTEKGPSELEVNLSGFDNGLYTFIIESDEQRYFTKLLLAKPW